MYHRRKEIKMFLVTFHIFKTLKEMKISQLFKYRGMVYNQYGIYNMIVKINKLILFVTTWSYCKNMRENQL